MQQQLRREQGEAVLANVAGPIIRSHLEAGKHVLIDAVYVRAEYKALIRHCGERSSIVIATHAPFSVRAQRMLSRNERAYSATELRARDLHEVLNLNTGAAIALADFHVVNDGSLQDLHDNLTKIWNHISQAC
jgi:dephospho-CoA kinase